MNPGDVVQLKSGGPKMTFCSKNHDMLCCYWFSGDSLQKDNFPECALKNVKPDKLNQEN